MGYLAGASAGRCGPCRNGLPALAASGRRARGRRRPGGDPPSRGARGVLPGRGACAHPDGSVRLVASMLTAFPEEVRAHEAGHLLRVGADNSRADNSSADNSRADNSSAGRPAQGAARLTLLDVAPVVRLPEAVSEPRGRIPGATRPGSRLGRSAREQVPGAGPDADRVAATATNRP